MVLTDFIRDIHDFPKQGVIFKDITPLLKDSKAIAAAAQQLEGLIGSRSIDKVVGMESRGFFFATLLAVKLDAGFVPVRKPNKLPAPTVSECYSLEYGDDVLEMHADAIRPGDRVLIHDDVLATGGTAEAVCKLVEQLGGTIVQLNFLMELKFLKGREKLSGYEVRSLLAYG